MRNALLLLAFGALPLAAQQQAAAKKDAGASREIPETQLIELSRTVKALRVEPDTIRIKVGQSVSLDRFTVTVIDSANKVHGRLVGYDFAIRPGEPASAVPRTITGVRPGTTQLAVRYPRTYWKVRTDPRVETKVTVVVTP